MKKLNHKKMINTTYGKATKTKEKGITLIALVITIIVLLILAGVAIATLLGDNGIITRATTAKEKTQQAGVVERVQMEVQGSYTDGNIDVTELSKNLGNISGIDGLPISTLPATVTLEGYDVTIKKDGTVTAFNRKEWDKTATPEDCFYWESDNIGEEGYNTVIGYKEKINDYTKLRFPSRCTKIEFRNTSNYGDGVGTTESRAFTNNILKVEIPETVTSIESSAFGWGGGTSFTNLKEINIPNNVTSIKNDTFWSCKGLTEITIPDSVTSIGNYAFHSCTGLTNITIPNSVTSIGNYAFYFCTGLTNITIPSSVTSIGEGAFFQCKGLINITIPKSVTSIEGWAFSDCTGLTEIKIPESVTSIGNGAFQGCTSLKNITIPSSVKSIGVNAFGYIDEYQNSTISENAVFHVVQDSYADKWVQDNKLENQTIEYITE